MEIELSTKFVIISILSLVLSACNKPEPQKQASPDWLKDEILVQLSELRRDIKSFKADVVELNTKFYIADGRGASQAPKQVKLDAPMIINGD